MRLLLKAAHLDHDVDLLPRLSRAGKPDRLKELNQIQPAELDAHKQVQENYQAILQFLDEL